MSEDGIKLRGLLENVNYCILHGWQGLPQSILSDIDIVVAKKDLLKIETTFLDNTLNLYVANYIQYKSTGYRFDIVSQEQEAIHFIPLDIVVDFRWKGRVWFSNDELLGGRKKWKDFWVAAPEVEFKYLLIKKILKGAFPLPTARRIQELVVTLDKKADALTEDLLGRKWASQVMVWIRSGAWKQMETHVPVLQKVLKRQRLYHDPLNPLRYWLSEIPRLWRRGRYPTGLLIVVLGPDGAGKSTLIGNLQRELHDAFRHMMTFHLVPRFLWSRKERRSVTDPHGKPPRGWLASLFKLGYYWLEYTLGYWGKIRPALVRSTLVLFDRYYDDLLVDPKRYRYGGPMRLARWLRHFIPRPDFWFIIDVPEEEILRRKQEVPLEEIRYQRQAYQKLAMELPNAILLDGSLPPKEVVHQARDAMLVFLHERYLARRHVWFRSNRKQETLEWTSKVLEASGSPQVKPFLYIALPDGRGYLLPQDSRKAALQGLSLYNPQKLKAKVAKSLLSLGIRAGITQHVLPKLSLDLSHLRSFLEEIFHRKDLTLAVSLGTPGPHRKPVVQVMTSKGEVLGYVKVGWNEKTNILVQHESEVLHQLSDVSFDSFVTPSVYYAGQWEGRFICIQSAPDSKAKSASSQLTSQYLSVLKELATFHKRRMPLGESSFWTNLLQRIERVQNSYYRHVLEQGVRQVERQLGNNPLPFHLRHGDFAPWNAYMLNGKLFLFDWEYAEWEAPPGWDLFHFIVQTLWLLEGRTPGEIYNMVLREMAGFLTKTYWKELGLEKDTIYPLFLVYLLDRLAFYASEEVNFQKLQRLAMLANLCIYREVF